MAAPVPVNPYGMPSDAQPVTDKEGHITPPWKMFLVKLVKGLFSTGVTHTATLATNELAVGTGPGSIGPLGALGSTTTVLHGNAAGVPSFSAVDLTADVTADLPFANLVNASGASKLVGRGSAAGAGVFQEITLDSTLAMTGTVLSASSGLHLSLTTIANADLLTLPMTAVPLVAAPGAGFRLALLYADLRLALTTVYGNVDAGAYLFIGNGSNVSSNFIANDATTSPVLADATNFLHVNAVSTVQLINLSQVTTPAASGWGNVAAVQAADGGNLPLSLNLSNGGSGNLTGGNAANVLTARVWYFVVPIP